MSLTGSCFSSESAPGRATVIAGKRYEDDYTVIWRGLSIGRIMQASGVPSPPRAVVVELFRARQTRRERQLGGNLYANFPGHVFM